MTLFFRHLADVQNAESDADRLSNAYYAPDQISMDTHHQTQHWLRDYLNLAQQQGRSHQQRADAINATNPLYVPRNYLAQLAIDDAESWNFQRLSKWMQVLSLIHI